ncbi:MAG: hypothetical protein E7660_07115 [Ruminococcaceae bacterium]|nr:hypothetical protein [Oscillospiraceae bacterium]
MKKVRTLTCILLAIVICLGAVAATAGKAPYEISDGSAVFNSANTVSYFDKGGEINSLSISYAPAQNAAQLTVSGSGSDPYALLSYSKLGVNLSASTYKYIVLTYKVPDASHGSDKAEIFYCAGNVTVPTGGHSVGIALSKDGAYHSQIIDMSANSAWTGRIYGLRLDPFTSASVGNVMYVDSIILAKTSAEANQIATYRQNKANGLTDDMSHTVEFTADNYASYLKSEAATALAGDANGDGEVTAKDVIVLKKYLGCIDVDINLDAADVNGDGILSVKDSLMLKKVLKGIVSVDGTAGGIAKVEFDGAAVLTAQCTTPYVNVDYTADSADLNAGQYNYIVLTYKTDKTGSASVKANADSAAHSFTLNADGTYHSVVIDMSDDSAWSGDITGFVFNFFDSAANGNKLYLDSVALAETSGVATAIADYREALANGYTFTDKYKLDISAETLGMINTPGTYSNIGPTINGELQPFTTTWPAAGYTAARSTGTLLGFLSYNNYIKVADCIDLSKYSAVTITYGTDASYKAYNSEFGFFSEPTVFGQLGSKNAANLHVSVKTSTPVASGSSNWVSTRTVTTPINSAYVGPLYMSFYMDTGDGALVTDITFTLKEAVVDKETDTVNNVKGENAYTVSSNGATISADGQTYPYASNYTSGITVATDDVGRELYTTSDSVIKNYDFTDKNVGIFYFLWLGAHGTGGPYDIQKLVNQYGVGNIPGNSSVWGPMNEHHFFSEPLFGYYFSNDEWVIRKHIEELTNADVDFIFFDVTNGVPYIDTAKKVMKVVHEFNEMGYNPPKVVFYCNNSHSGYTGSISILQYLYNNIYSVNYLPDTWFCYEGKPVIIGKQTEFNALPAAARNMFTFRQSQWPDEAKKANAWSWMDFTDPAVPNYNTAGKLDAINVSIAQHMGTIAFGDSGIYGYNIVPSKVIFTSKLNHGRNWHDGKNETFAGAYKYGYNFQEQWDTVHDSYPDVPVVLVTGWNEWAAGKIDTTGTLRDANNHNMALFVDTATVDFSRDAEMIRGYYFDNYYMQLIYNVRRYKGAAPTLVQNSKKRIDILGSFDQWNDITLSYRDATGETYDRNAQGFGGNVYVNSSVKNDLKSAKVVCDTEYAYFYVEANGAISSYNKNASWMKLYIDIDSSASTGWYGYDYIVNYSPSSSTKTSLAKSNSSSYSFTVTDSNIAYRIEGKMMMVRVPLASLGITDYNDISFSFKWADSESVIDTMEEMYTDGDTMPHGRLNYFFTNKEQ